MTDPKRTPNKLRRPLFWLRKAHAPNETVKLTFIAEEAQERPWYRPTVLKIAALALVLFIILPARAHGQFGIDTAAIMAALSKMQSLMNT